VAGDRVLSETKHGDLFIDRVVVNQHLKSKQTAKLFTLRSGESALSLTANHLIWIDGEFKPAREAKVGSILSRGHVVESIMESQGRIINPITRSGTILAMEEGSFVLAATGEEWLSDILFSYPNYSLSIALGSMFPTQVQSYYDAVLEPIFDNTVSMLALAKKHAPTWLIFAGVFVGDFLLVLGFGFFVGFCVGFFIGFKLVLLGTVAAFVVLFRRKQMTV
jgi:hypothetical protein